MRARSAAETPDTGAPMRRPFVPDDDILAAVVRHTGENDMRTVWLGWSGYQYLLAEAADELRLPYQVVANAVKRKSGFWRSERATRDGVRRHRPRS